MSDLVRVTIRDIISIFRRYFEDAHGTNSWGEKRITGVEVYYNSKDGTFVVYFELSGTWCSKTFYSECRKQYQDKDPVFLFLALRFYFSNAFDTKTIKSFKRNDKNKCVITRTYEGEEIKLNYTFSL